MPLGIVWDGHKLASVFIKLSRTCRVCVDATLRQLRSSLDSISTVGSDLGWEAGQS